MRWGRTPTYRSWENMKRRCSGASLKHAARYAARGIAVCDRWMKFENFLADMGERPVGRTLDRKDNNGNYEPGNCRWATPKEQAANRRLPHNIITCEGFTLREWSDLTGICYQTLEGRMRKYGTIHKPSTVGV